MYGADRDADAWCRGPGRIRPWDRPTYTGIWWYPYLILHNNGKAQAAAMLPRLREISATGDSELWCTFFTVFSLALPSRARPLLSLSSPQQLAMPPLATHYHIQNKTH